LLEKLDLPGQMIRNELAQTVVTAARLGLAARRESPVSAAVLTSRTIADCLAQSSPMKRFRYPVQSRAASAALALPSSGMATTGSNWGGGKGMARIIGDLVVEC
jgi:hypothetical protein